MALLIFLFMLLAVTCLSAADMSAMITAEIGPSKNSSITEYTKDVSLNDLAEGISDIREASLQRQIKKIVLGRSPGKVTNMSELVKALTRFIESKSVQNNDLETDASPLNNDSLGGESTLDGVPVLSRGCRHDESLDGESVGKGGGESKPITPPIENVAPQKKAAGWSVNRSLAFGLFGGGVTLGTAAFIAYYLAQYKDVPLKDIESNADRAIVGFLRKVFFISE